MHTKTSRPTKQLTPRQFQLLQAISDFQASRCYSPTIGELASELGISRSTTFEHIAELRRKGLLSARAGRARSLTPTCQAQRVLSGRTQAEAGSCRGLPEGIPLMGTVAAGLPIEAIEDRDCLSLNSYFGGGDDVFALKVRGNSMVGEDIRDGDYVICRRTAVADNGQLVVAIVDDEHATLKRFYREKSRARLQPANDDYEPTYSGNCRIEAVVVGLLRRL